MAKKREIFGFYKDIIDVNRESVIKLDSYIIASIIYLLPINKSKNEKSPSYKTNIDKSKAYYTIKHILEINKEIIINDKNYKSKKIEKIESNTIYIKSDSSAYLDRFNESLRNAFAHGNVYKKNDKLIIYNVNSGCKRITLYFETKENNFLEMLEYYKTDICKDDAKVVIKK